MWRNLAFFTCCALVLAFTAPAGDSSDLEHPFIAVPHGIVVGESCAEWDQVEGTCWLAPPRCGEEISEGFAPILALEQCPQWADKDDTLRQSTSDLEEEQVVSGIVLFVNFKSPKEFVKHWAEQKRLFKSLPRPLTPEQRRMLQCTYYRFVAAGRLLKELGKTVFLKKFGLGTVSQMQEATVAEMKQSRISKRAQKVRAVDVEGTEGADHGGNVDNGDNAAADIASFVRPKSPQDFVRQWPKQKRLFKSLPFPRTLEHRHILRCVYYPFVAAGRLLKELGKKKFLKKFGADHVTQMRDKAVAEIKQRKAAEHVKGSKKVPDVVEFVRPKSPEDFVEQWPEQKYLFESLPRPLTLKQRQVARRSYYSFSAAGWLLEELGKEAFLEKFRGGSMSDVQRAAASEKKQRMAVKKDLIVDVGSTEKGILDVLLSARAKSPEDFVKRWPEQKRLFKNLPRPLTVKQRHLLNGTYYPFTAAGQLLEELGEKGFLKRFGRSSVTRMQKITVAEIRQRRAAEEDLEMVVVDVEDTEEGHNPDIVAFVRPKSPEDFARRWPEQRRLFEGLPFPRTREQVRVLNSTYYPFTGVGQLLEELGEEAFLSKFGGSTVTQMQKETAAEIRQRAIKRGREMARFAKGIVEKGQTLGSVASASFKSPKEFAKRWPKQERLFQSFSHPLTPEQRHALQCAYYPFGAAGQLLGELGEKMFLSKFGKGSVAQMQKDTAAEIRQRRVIGEDLGVDVKEPPGVGRSSRARNGDEPARGAGRADDASTRSQRGFTRLGRRRELLDSDSYSA